MNGTDIREMLTASLDAQQITIWLRNEYFPEIVRRFNLESSRKRFGLYQNEQIPVNERNLTDVRTRMGVLIEFELARISNEILPENGIDDIFWSYVVANRFPDLEVRRNTGDRLLRLEIKCLQCIAEEKSANFDTLIKDIDPQTDYVVVCLWDWTSEGKNNCDWDTAPKIYKVYVFHAYSLIMLRDTYWLNRPPQNLGTGYQGFDIRYAVTCNEGVFSKEQGNYGKLTRIWTEGFQYRPRETDLLADTEAEFLKFQEEIIFAGFQILANMQLKQLRAGEISTILNDGNKIVGFKLHDIAYMRSSAITKRRLVSFARENQLSVLVTMTDKYRSTVFVIADGTVSELARNEKPKNVVDIIRRSGN